MRTLICVILSVFIFAGCATGRNQDDSKPVKIKNLKRDSDGIYRVPKAKPIKLKQEKVIEEKLDIKRLAESAREVALAAKKKYEQRASSVSNYQQPQESLARYYMNLIATALVQVGVLLFGLKLFKGLL
tara:strand:- start:1603 stop:1989 length:387 start_codon:yes stop_codon:yes gene_type:complete